MQVILQGGPEDLDSAACPFTITPVDGKVQEWHIDVPWPEEPGAPWELLKWFAEVVQSSGAADKRGAQKQKQPELAAGRRIIMALPATLSRDSRALWHKIVEGFREPVAMTAISNGVGTGRHLQVLPAAGREGAHKGKPRVVSEQAKELWNWCQEEGGANWLYSQGEIEDLLQSKQPLPPELQQLMDARAVGMQLFESIERKQEAEAIQIIDKESRSAYMRDSNRHGYAIHHVVFQDLQHVAARLAIMPGVLQQKDSRRQTPMQLAHMLKRQDILDILMWAAS